MNNAPKPTWGDLKDTLEKMVAFPAGEGWHVSREAADKALEWITWAETHQPNPVPKILPEEDEDVSLVWHTADGWAVHRTFPKDDEPYWLAIPSARPEALASSPEVADAQAAQAMVVVTIQDAVQKLRREAAGNADGVRFQALDDVRHLIRDLADIDGLALVQELRDRAAKAESHAKSTNSVWQRNLELIAERDRLAAANAVLEAKVAGLVEAAEDAEYDLLQWLDCSKGLTAAGFNMDGTAEVTAKLTAALSHIKRGKTNG